MEQLTILLVACVGLANSVAILYLTRAVNAILRTQRASLQAQIDAQRRAAAWPTSVWRR